MALDFLTGATQPFEVAGQTFQVGPIRLAEIGQLMKYIRLHAVKPTEIVRQNRDLIDPEDWKRAVTEAVAEETNNWPPSVGSEEGNRILFAQYEGQREFVRVVLSKHQTISETDLDELMKRVTELDIEVLCVVAYGVEGLSPKKIRDLILAYRFPTPNLEPSPETNTLIGEDSSTT